MSAILVDFDGTACLHDASNCLLDRFSTADWIAIEEEIERNGEGLRLMMRREATSLRGTREEMIAHNLAHCPMDPTFAPFVRWAEERGYEVAIVSDGFGFNVPPLLEAAGVGHLRVVSNDLVPDGDGWNIVHPSGNPACHGCGTCKMAAVEAARLDGGHAIFIGNGTSDRFAAMHADVAFAKDALVTICRRDGVAFRPWADFDDVRRSLEADPAVRLAPAPGPSICSGWTPTGADRAWTVRPARREDAQGVFEVLRDDERVHAVEPMWQLEDVLADWSRPSFDPARDQVVVEDPDRPGRIVATAGIERHARFHAGVLPEHHGRGIGSSLIRWAERETLRRADLDGTDGEVAVNTSLPDTALAAAALLRRRGWEPFYAAWVLRLDADAPLPTPPIPAGITFRAPRWDEEARACFRIVEDAFAHWPGRHPNTFENWAAWYGRDDFDPAHATVAVQDGELVGVVAPIQPGEFWIQQVAVRVDRQGRGIGSAMLAESFRVGRAAGYGAIGLSTDSRTGALPFYERLGMRVTSSYTNHRRVLRAAR
ncbi:MAG: MtnX-like HAD-IB family phosphatase [Actinomycetota bacterium]